MWEICHAHNPHHYSAACQDLLETDDAKLDLGYTLVLKHDALRGRSLGEAVAYLMSRPVQQSVEGICWNAKCHSLDVERKHNQDKASEGRRVISVSAASRNSILQRYRLQRSKVIEESIKDRRRAAKDIYMNTRAIAIAERPDLFKRGTGKLWWQSARSQAERQIIIHAGDETALQTYINEH